MITLIVLAGLASLSEEPVEAAVTPFAGMIFAPGSFSSTLVAKRAVAKSPGTNSPAMRPSRMCRMRSELK